MPQVIQLTTTTAERVDADRIARSLVEQQLAACVQVSGPITSCYRWLGSVETSEEWLCTAKTTQAAGQAAVAAIRAMHPYDEPEIIATPIVDGSDSYLQWIVENVTPSRT